MKFSKKRPIVYNTLKDYYEQKELKDLADEFERLMLLQRTAESYITKSKPPKK